MHSHQHRHIIANLIRAVEQAIHEFWENHRHIAHVSKIETNIFNIKFISKMAKIKLPSGTPASGSAIPVDAKGNDLAVKAFKAGSIKWSVTDGAGFSVAPGASEDKYVLTETAPGTNSKGTLLLDAQDVDGNALPQSSLDFEFDQVAAVAVGSRIVSDQASHDELPDQP